MYASFATLKMFTSYDYTNIDTIQYFKLENVKITLAITMARIALKSQADIISVMGPLEVLP